MKLANCGLFQTVQIKQPSNKYSCLKSLYRAGETGQLWLFLAVQSKQPSNKFLPKIPRQKLVILANCGLFLAVRVKQPSNKFLPKIPRQKLVILANCDCFWLSESNNRQTNSCLKSLYKASETGQLGLFQTVRSNNRQTSVPR